MDFYCDELFTGRISVKRVLETENVLAFHHTNPFWPVHIVVVPKKASSTRSPPSSPPICRSSRELLTIAAELCRKVVAEHGGCRLSTNCGNYQCNTHLHFYIHHGERLRNEDGSVLPPH